MISRINNVQALRALAALLIVYYHSGFRLWGLAQFGAFSVPLFFVISGFVMAMVATEQPQQFLRRRLVRAVPIYWMGTIVVFCIALYSPLLFHSTRPNLGWLLESLFFIPFAKAPGIIEPLMFVGWTMNCEIILYLLVALGLWLTPRRPVLFACVALLAFMAACSALADRSIAAFFYSRSTMLDFVMGLALYPLWKKITEERARALRWYALAALVVLLVALCATESVGIAPYLTADSMFAARPLVSESGVVLVVLSALIMAQGGLDVQSAWLMLIADSTFVLYLTHAYVLLAFAKVGVHFSPRLALTEPLGLVVAASGSLILAVAMHVRFERPLNVVLKRAFLASEEVEAPHGKRHRRGRHDHAGGALSDRFRGLGGRA